MQADVGALSAGDTKSLFTTLLPAADQLSALLIVHVPLPPKGTPAGKTGGKKALPAKPNLKSPAFVAAQNALAARLQLRTSKVRRFALQSPFECSTVCHVETKQDCCGFNFCGDLLDVPLHADGCEPTRSSCHCSGAKRAVAALASEYLLATKSPRYPQHRAGDDVAPAAAPPRWLLDEGRWHEGAPARLAGERQPARGECGRLRPDT